MRRNVNSTVMLSSVTVPLAEQEMITVPEHLSSPRVFCGLVLLDLCVLFCRSLFVLFLLAIVLSVLLRFTDSDHHLVSSNF